MVTVKQEKRLQDLADAIVKRQGRFELDRELTDALWDDIETYLFPRRGVYNLGNRSGARKGAKLGSNVYDMTAAQAGQDLADGFQGYSASPAIQWWDARLRSEEAMRDRVCREWLSTVTKQQSDEMAQSNFYEQLNMVVTDAVFYGPGTMLAPRWDPAEGKLVYQSLHPREVFFARDATGRINIWHRKFPISGRQILDEFPTAVLPEELAKSIERDPWQDFMCIHAIYKRTERDIAKLNAANKRIASVYVLQASKYVLSEKGFDDWPLNTWSWRLNSTETYPRSPAIDNIYEAMSTNTASKAVLQSAQIALQPQLIADESLKDRVKLGPFGITWRSSPTQTVERLYDAQANYPVGVDQVQKLREDLRNAFKANTFTLLSTMTQRMTAYQAGEIQGEKAAMLGPLITRSQSELLGPLINQTFRVLVANKRLPPPPTEVQKFLNTPVDITFSGPVALSQRRFLQMQGLTSALSQAAALMQPGMFPNMKDKLDEDALLDYIWDAAGAPVSVIRKDEALMSLRQGRAKMQAQAANMVVGQQKEQTRLTAAKADAETGEEE